MFWCLFKWILFSCSGEREWEQSQFSNHSLMMHCLKLVHSSEMFKVSSLVHDLTKHNNNDQIPFDMRWAVYHLVFYFNIFQNWFAFFFAKVKRRVYMYASVYMVVRWRMRTSTNTEKKQHKNYRFHAVLTVLLFAPFLPDWMQCFISTDLNRLSRKIAANKFRW